MASNFFGYSTDVSNPTTNSVGPAMFVPQRQQGLVTTQYQAGQYGQPVTYSYSDCNAHVIFPFSVTNLTKSPTYMLPGLQLLSISTHRDVYPVVSGGRRGIRGYTKGHRTTAGTLGFNILGESPWSECMRAYARWKGVGLNLIYSHPDELPPFDIMIMFVTDALDTSVVYLRSVQILDGAQNVNINDIQLTSTYSFLCAECTEMVNLPSPVRNVQNSSDLVFPTAYGSARNQLREVNTEQVPAVPVYIRPEPVEPTTP